MATASCLAQHCSSGSRVLGIMSAVLLAVLELLLAAITLVRIFVITGVAVAARVLPCPQGCATFCCCQGEGKGSKCKSLRVDTCGKAYHVQQSGAAKSCPAGGPAEEAGVRCSCTPQVEPCSGWHGKPEENLGFADQVPGGPGACHKACADKHNGRLGSRGMDVKTGAQQLRGGHCCETPPSFRSFHRFIATPSHHSGSSRHGSSQRVEEYGSTSIAPQDFVNRSPLGVSIQLGLRFEAASEKDLQTGSYVHTDTHMCTASSPAFGHQHCSGATSEQWKAVEDLQHELEEERNAAEVAAAEALKMITRLQSEKAALQSSLRQAAQLENERAMQRDSLVDVLEGVIAQLEEDRSMLQQENARQREFMAAEAARWQPGCSGFVLLDPWSGRRRREQSVPVQLQRLLAREQQAALLEGEAHSLLLAVPRTDSWVPGGKDMRQTRSLEAGGQGSLPAGELRRAVSEAAGEMADAVQEEGRAQRKEEAGGAALEPEEYRSDIYEDEAGVVNQGQVGEGSQRPLGPAERSAGEPGGAWGAEPADGERRAAKTDLQRHVSLVSHPIAGDGHDENSLEGTAIPVPQGQGRPARAMDLLLARGGVAAGADHDVTTGTSAWSGIEDSGAGETVREPWRAVGDPAASPGGDEGAPGEGGGEGETSDRLVEMRKGEGDGATANYLAMAGPPTGGQIGRGSLSRPLSPGAHERARGEEGEAEGHAELNRKQGSSGGRLPPSGGEVAGGSDALVSEELAEKLATRRSLLTNNEMAQELEPCTPPAASPVDPGSGGEGKVAEVSGELAGKLASRRKWEQLWEEGGPHLWTSPSVASKGGPRPKTVRRPLFVGNGKENAASMPFQLGSIVESSSNTSGEVELAGSRAPLKGQVILEDAMSNESKRAAASSCAFEPPTELAMKLASRRRWET